MGEIKPNLPQWVDPGEVKHTWPPPDPKAIVSRELPRALLVGILEGTHAFNEHHRRVVKL